MTLFCLCIAVCSCGKISVVDEAVWPVIPQETEVIREVTEMPDEEKFKRIIIDASIVDGGSYIEILKQGDYAMPNGMANRALAYETYYGLEEGEGVNSWVNVIHQNIEKER